MEIVSADLLVSSERAAQLRTESRGWPSIDLTPRQLCDVELLLTGAFAPLRGFMGQAESEAVIRDGRLPDGVIWPSPVTLDLAPSIVHEFHAGDRVALRDHEGVMLAALNIGQVWSANRPSPPRRLP